MRIALSWLGLMPDCSPAPMTECMNEHNWRALGYGTFDAAVLVGRRAGANLFEFRGCDDGNAGGPDRTRTCATRCRNTLLCVRVHSYLAATALLCLRSNACGFDTVRSCPYTLSSKLSSGCTTNGLSLEFRKHRMRRPNRRCSPVYDGCRSVLPWGSCPYPRIRRASSGAAIRHRC